MLLPDRYSPILTLTLGVLLSQAAAHLAKADLATSTVMEMTALAGTMGRHFAHKQVRTGRGHRGEGR